MSDRFPGGVISKTPPTVVGPTDGEGGSASGVWTLDEVLGYEKAGGWPKGVLPRELYAWGKNDSFNSGQLGDNTAISKSSPIQVGSLTDWSQVSAGRFDTSAIKTNGTLWAWGRNNNGQVGDGTTIARSSPVQIGALTNWSQVSMGESTALAVKDDYTLWAWGSNYYGDFGDGTTINKSSPVQIGALTNWAQVSNAASRGGSSTAVKTDGTLWAWGRGTYGRIGDGTVVAKSSPVQIGALTTWAQVSAGNDHALARKTDGTLWVWGTNILGRLGTGNGTPDRSSPVQVGALTNWGEVAAGGAFSASVKTDGTLWTWGFNINGQVGDGTTINKSSPVQIGSLTDWSTINLGQIHAVAVKTDGTLWTWGDNNPEGQLGDGTTADRSSPIQVGALTNWLQASAGQFHTAAITRG